MHRVFISSVQRAFSEPRQAARQAIESLGLQPVMAETVGGTPEPPQAALLGEVDSCDAFVLILGGAYGYVAQDGRSATEQEFNRAREAGKPILAFVQEGVERAAEQQAFVDRVRGSWEGGRYAPGFTSPAELGFAVVKALRGLMNDQRDADAQPAAQDRAVDLAGGDRRHGAGQGSLMRVALVPVGALVLLDAVLLEELDLGNLVAGALRARGLVQQAAGIEATASGHGVTAIGKEPRAFAATTAHVGADGAVMVEADVASSGMLGGSVLSDERVRATVLGVSTFAQDVWAQIDRGARVRQVAAAVGVPDASYKSYASAAVGNSMTMATGMPPKLVAPTPPLLIRRQDVGADETTSRLVAALRRAFADHGALQDR